MAACPVASSRGVFRRDAKILRLLLTTAVSVGQAFYLPGFAPNDYQENSLVEMKVNKLTSTKTQLPYDYYTLPYCQPEKITENVENLGEQLMGDKIETSPYEIKMPINETCKKLCTKPLDENGKEMFRSMIDDEYLVNMIVDNLPVATRYRLLETSDQAYVYQNGFLVGAQNQGRYYVHNHISLVLQFHSNPEKYEGFRIVGADLEPLSTTSKDCSPGQPLDLERSKEITYTYDVRWVWSDVRWASRWDSYLKMTGGQIHWFAILNSIMILLFLSGMVAMILLRTLHRDITKYNELATAEEQKEETGWKLVHGDVFRKPPHSTLLCVSVGSGVQLLGMSVVTLLFALLGLISPARRGALLQTVMLLFTFMGIAAGYVSARMDKLFSGDASHWKCTTLMTAFLYPGICFLLFFVLDLLIWGQKSSGAVPFTTMFAVLVLWFGVSLPLVFLGAHAALKKDPIELPVRVNTIPRAVPENPWYTNPRLTAFIGGVLPFGAVFTELFFIMSSIWQHQFYYLFGFLALVLAILIITCAEVSIAMTYFQLTSEDYNWWWTSFLSSGTSGVYVFMYSIMYFNSRLQINRVVSQMLYFGYMGMISLLFCLLTGSIGLIASFFFVRAIYGSIKVD
eukprot:TRINITY_DN1865_c0_g1_i1.p1 TRINITY_DN1865_c0_g1~~TRINITY_DN1865_c0_g1_i1.p1  ORF type:complete len:625 (-),score=136.40 TRINITY_DN1865_c0_g1_i1:511-2385(-)